MAKALLLGPALALAVVTVASAQSDTTPPPPQTSGARSGASIRGGNITSTGATVPHPGASQGDGVTPMDRGIQREDDRITNSICKGC
jgi:hypothetical protein